MEALEHGVQNMLQRLRPSDREVLLLAAWEQLDSEALGIALEISSAAARKRLERARSRAQSIFNLDGVDSLETGETQ